MKKQNIFILAALLALCSEFIPLQAGLYAQIPRTLSYQGVLTDSSGNPKPDNTYSITFRMYDVAVGGNVLWTEVKSLQVKRGLFTTILGDLTPLPDSLEFDRPYWLSLQVSSEPELIPRLPLTAVGYSIYSLKSDTAKYAVTTPQPVFVDSARIAASVPDNSISGGKIANSQVVRSINNKKDNITIAGQGGATVTSGGDTIYINAGSGGDSTGIFGIQNTNNTLDITDPNGPTVTVNVKSGVFLPLAGGTMTGAITNTGNPSITMGKGNFGTGNTNNGVDAFVAGSNNKVRGSYSVVSGGGGASLADSNSVLGMNSFLGGGKANLITGPLSVVTGGEHNTATNSYTTISGGSYQSASGQYSTVGGGTSNSAGNNFVTIGGGNSNIASGVSSTISGGEGNFGTGDGATVGGGSFNKARGLYSVVSGGGGAVLTDSNSALGNYSTVAGGRSNLSNDVNTSVGGGRSNIADGTSSVISGGYLNRTNGEYSVVGGGYRNTTDGERSVVSGGSYNHARGAYSFVGGGGSIWDHDSNSAIGNNSTVCGGLGNLAIGYRSTISGGQNNRARGSGSVVSGGGGVSLSDSNSAIGDNATVGGGRSNHANNSYATVPGGVLNEALGYSSFAAGYRAKAINDGSFVWGDFTEWTEVESDTTNQYKIRASNGVNIASAAGSSKEIRKGDYYRDNAIVAWGKVSGGGSISTYEFGIVSVVRNSAGNYTLTLDAGAASANTLIPLAIAETDTPPNSAATVRVVSINQVTATTFGVYILNGNWTSTDNDFTFIVTGR